MGNKIDILSSQSYAEQTRTISEQQMKDKEINQHIKRYYDAMIAGDIDALATMLDDHFTLTHITGYIQPKTEWLTQMQEGQFVYYQIKEQSSAITIIDHRVHIASKTITDAKIYGMRNNWRLQLITDMEKRNNQWLITKTVASTW